MIEQVAIGLNSRSEANPYNENGFLPLITAPMYSVVDENNYQTFLDNKIQVCLPREKSIAVAESPEKAFVSYSLNDFIEIYIDDTTVMNKIHKVCIDTANGNMPALHDVIRKAKEIHGDKLIIMAGNVASVEAFAELAKTGVDYIRVGIGGGGGCNTTNNTGVGQDDLKQLIQDCFRRRKNANEYLIFANAGQDRITHTNLSNVKIVADGISSYIKLCQEKYNFNDNGYAAINKLLFAGADLVMVGSLFAQCIESAGEKCLNLSKEQTHWFDDRTITQKDIIEEFFPSPTWSDKIQVKLSGMSTQEEQKKYKDSEFYWKWWWGINEDDVRDETIFYDHTEMKVFSAEHSRLNKCEGYYSTYRKYENVKPSEGSVKWIPVRWKLSEWLNGSDKQDEAPYLMGWINSIKSAMSYTGKTKLE